MAVFFTHYPSWMIEGFIHGRKLVYATARNSPVERDLDKLMGNTRTALVAAATDAAAAHPSAATLGSLAPKSGATPVMLPSPASLAPSANSTPTNRDGTPSSTAGSISSATAPHPVAAALAPSTLPSTLLPPEYKHVPIAPHIANAMELLSLIHI